MFGTKTTEVEFHGVVYTIAKFSAWESAEILADLQDHILPVVAEMVDGGNDGIARAIYTISSKLSKAKFNEICKVLLFGDNIYFQKDGNDAAKLTNANKGVAFEEAEDIVLLLVEVVKYNFGGFIASFSNLFTK